MDFDFDACEHELNSEIENLKLLRQQLHSVQSIRNEQHRKDEIISKLKERVKALEQRQDSLDDIKDHFAFETRRVTSLYESELDVRVTSLQTQVETLKGEMQRADELRASERSKYATTYL